MIFEARGKKPIIGKNCYIAPTATIVGDVVLGDNTSVWFNTVIRGDVMPVRIGKECNIQDGSIVHGTYNKCGVELADRVSVGHGVILHGCRVERNVLIGMGSILMDNVVVAERCLVGAGSLLTEESQFSAGVLVLGRPAVVRRNLKSEELEFLEKYADKYLFYKGWYNGQKESGNGN
ncbi:MAG: gamma carbonic anhydrase family protein [Proteobacteria bacterium SG_bin7]|nr:MAG: gamma carbonic anhydrase family protein [Proteobacteria bacterium SG_bin7]